MFKFDNMNYMKCFGKSLKVLWNVKHTSKLLDIIELDPNINQIRYSYKFMSSNYPQAIYLESESRFSFAVGQLNASV